MMMFKKAVFCCLWAVVFLASVQCQPESAEVDHFGKISCDDFLARADNFFQVLDKNPGVQGYFVIYAGDDDWRRTLAYQRLLDDALTERRFDRTRITTVRAPKTGNDIGAGFFWISGAATSAEAWSPKWNLGLPTGTKPFIFNTGFAEMCASPLNVLLLNSYLDANPGSQVRAVIHSGSKSRREGLAEAKAALMGVSPDRTRYSFKKLRGYDVAIVEYWFVPNPAR